MKTLLVGLIVGGVSGFALQKYVLTEDTGAAARHRRDTETNAATGGVKREKTPEIDVDLLLAKIRDLEAKLAAAKGAGEGDEDLYGGVEVPLTEEGIVTLLESFERTGSLDQLLALIKALLLQGEKGYPRLTRVLIKMVGMGMANRWDEEQLIKRIVPAARMAMQHERQLVGYVGYLLTNDNVPSMMRTGAMGAAMFLSINGVQGSEEFAPKLLEAFLANQGPGGDDQQRMLLEAMGMLRQKEAVQPLLAILRDPQRGSDHRRVIEALGRIGDERAVGVLIQRLRMEQPTDNRNWWSGRSEIQALARIGTDEALASVETHLGNLTTDNAFYNQAGAYLRVRKSDKVVGMIRDRFRADPGQSNMWGAVSALRSSGSPAAWSVLEEISRDSTQPQVSEYAKRILSDRAKLTEAQEAVSSGD